MSLLDPPFLWLLAALVLVLLELATGGLVLLALGAAAAGVAALAWLGAALTGQLVGMAVLSGILVPVAVKWVKPRFSPKGVGYGTTGAGAEQGRTFVVSRRGFDDMLGVNINGDFYPARHVDAPAVEVLPLGEGQLVRFVRFDGTTALVRPADDIEGDS